MGQEVGHGRDRTGPERTGAQLEAQRPSEGSNIASRAHAASLARTHERNETISRSGRKLRSSPPTSDNTAPKWRPYRLEKSVLEVKAEKSLGS